MQLDWEQGKRYRDEEVKKVEVTTAGILTAYEGRQWVGMKARQTTSEGVTGAVPFLGACE